MAGESSSWSGINLGQDPFSTGTTNRWGAGTPGNYIMPVPKSTAGINMGVLGAAEGAAQNAQGQGQAGINAATQGSQSIYNTANQLKGMGAGISNEFAGNAAYADQALKDAFDPQQAAMKSGLAQVQDSTSAALANSGLASTPYGASIGAGATGNFMNNWQTQQINRENTGMGTATGLQGQELAAQTQGGNMINAAGQLDQGAMNGILSQYGLSEQASAQAAQTLASIFGSLGTSQSQSVTR